MAGGRIKGITIELNGDSTKLEVSLKSVNSEIKNTESKLKDVNKLLKMDPGNTNLLSQKYKTLQQEIGATKEKLNTLKEAVGADVSIAQEPANIDGGFILSYGGIEENCSFDAIFRSEREKLQDIVSGILFKDETSK